MILEYKFSYISYLVLRDLVMCIKSTSGSDGNFEQVRLAVSKREE